MRVLMRPIRSRATHPNWSGIVREVEKAMDDEVKPRVLGYYEKIVANWSNKPVFRARRTIWRGGVALDVWPTGPGLQYWQWTSRGTRPHRITPRKYGWVSVGPARERAVRKERAVLAFPSAYAPKTSPHGPSYGGPGKGSGPTVFATEVHHPGTRPRHFEEAIARWCRPWFAPTIERAMRRGIRKA